MFPLIVPVPVRVPATWNPRTEARLPPASVVVEPRTAENPATLEVAKVRVPAAAVSGPANWTKLPTALTNRSPVAVTGEPEVKPGGLARGNPGIFRAGLAPLPTRK